jgi:hypothetical protein
MGFAPPPRDGFALLAAHTRMRLHAHIITNGRRIRNDFESAGGSFFEISRQWGPKKPHRAGSRGLVCKGAIIVA